MAPLLLSRAEAGATIHKLHNTLLVSRAEPSSPDTTTATTTGPTALTLTTLVILVLIAAAILICSRASHGYDNYLDEVLRRRDEVTTRLLGRNKRKRKVSGPIEEQDVEMVNMAGSSASRDDEPEPVHWHGSNLLNTSWGWMG